jgi:hypothetical protein
VIRYTNKTVESARHKGTGRKVREEGDRNEPIRDMLSLLDQSVDDSPEGKKGLVDVSGLDGSLVDRSRTGDVLRSGKIDQVQFADFEEIVSCRGGLLHMDGDGENGV